MKYNQHRRFGLISVPPFTTHTALAFYFNRIIRYYA